MAVHNSQKELTFRACLIGVLGSALITTSSLYVALKLGALPWPIIFVALCSLIILRSLGNTNLSEVNVAHTAMSAGAMIAGGVAFTIPGIWMIYPQEPLHILPLLCATISGTVMGLIFSALIRKHFIVNQNLSYPMGQAAAQTLITTQEGGKKSRLLFGSLAVSAIIVILRDVFLYIPRQVFTQLKLAGIPLAVNISPMMMAAGYIIGPVNISVWFFGALFGHFVLLAALPSLGIMSGDFALAAKSSLGIGIMLGSGLGVLLKHVLPKSLEIFAPLFKKDARDTSIISMRWAPFCLVVLVACMSFILHFSLLASILCMIGAWVAVSMAAQSVGDTAIDPMEVFAVIMLMITRAITELAGIEAFMFACVIAVACGLAGDVMSDFKAGQIIETSPRAQWIGQAVGALVGAFVSVGALYFLLKAYGTDAFGGGKEFIAVQASVVANMIQGAVQLPSLYAGIVVGAGLYFLRFPVMTLGLGVYLPLHLSLTAATGGLIRVVSEVFLKRRALKQGAAPYDPQNGLIVASGILGGEAVVSVIIAIIMVFLSM